MVPKRDRADHLGADHDGLAARPVEKHSRGQPEQDSWRESHRPEQAHLERRRVEGHRRRDREGDESELVADQRDALAEPELDELSAQIKSCLRGGIATVTLTSR
jgi:hypothetical protein